MTPTDTTRPADGTAPDSGHTETHDAREGLRMALAPIVARVYASRGYHVSGSRIHVIREVDMIEALAAVLPGLLAEAWDEGRRAGVGDLDQLDNPYRTERTSA